MACLCFTPASVTTSTSTGLLQAGPCVYSLAAWLLASHRLYSTGWYLLDRHLSTQPTIVRSCFWVPFVELRLHSNGSPSLRASPIKSSPAPGTKVDRRTQKRSTQPTS